MSIYLQKLKNNPARRRQRLVNSSPYTPGRGKDTPRSKQLLGRTPTKLYRFFIVSGNHWRIKKLIAVFLHLLSSPFGIETPSSRRQRNHQNFYGKPNTYTPTRATNNKRSGNSSNNVDSGPIFNAVSVYSPTQVLFTRYTCPRKRLIISLSLSSSISRLFRKTSNTFAKV